MLHKIVYYLRRTMKQITFRDIQRGLGWTKELPVQVTRYGVVVATLCDGSQIESLERKIKLLEQYIQEQEL